MKTFSFLCLAGLLAGTLPIVPLAAATTTAARPNILFIAIDDLRPELGCYGDTQVKSPNIDKLAAQGLVFTRAYCQVPVCGASRASLLTGILPTPERFRIARTLADEDAPGAVTLPQVFKQAGYTTLSNGKIFHFGPDTQERSWSRPAWHSGLSHSTNLDPVARSDKSSAGRSRMYESPDVPDNAYGDGKVAEKTIADLRQLKADGKPFFVACGFIRPHMPFYAPKKYWDLYDRSKIELA
ncbi:MAG: sulfatase-like hydrolase/transferase, partial [Chthoniobacteraceae bacterium]